MDDSIFPKHLRWFFYAGQGLKVSLNDTIYYEGGHTVNGNISFTLDLEESNFEINLALIGQERINWDKMRYYEYRSPDCISISDNLQTYYGKSTVLKSIKPLSPGKYSYPFKFKIPDYVPPSCMYSLGSK